MVCFGEKKSGLKSLSTARPTPRSRPTQKKYYLNLHLKPITKNHTKIKKTTKKTEQGKGRVH